MSNKYGACKYCHKPLEKAKCPNDKGGDIFGFDILIEVVNISVYLLFLVLSYLSKNINKKERKSIKIITCNNEDCINYLKGCFNGKGLYT